MTIQQTCQRLGKSESTIRRWIRSGKLYATIIDGVYDIQLDSPSDQPSPSQNEQMPSQNDQLITELRSEIDYLKKLLEESQQARERADMIAMQLSRQLDQKALEAPKTSWLRRIFTKRPT